MKIVGITGGVAMGKSTLARMLCYRHYRVFDADACVHRLYRRDRDFLSDLQCHFLSAFPQKILNKTILAQKVFADPAALALLESLLHPKVCHQAYRFIQSGYRSRQSVIFLDIPLLWSHGWDSICDAVIVVYCQSIRQQRRVLSRGWDIQRLHQVRAQQTSIAMQKRLADFCLSSDRGLGQMQRDLSKILDKI